MRVMLFALAAHALLVVAGCTTKYSPVDLDEDGYSPEDGDCNEGDAGINPGAPEIWYDGIDQNCDGNDADKDGDGYLAVDAGGSSGDPLDCWDDPDTSPEAYTVVSGQGWASVSASEVYPGAADIWYDGVDQDCAGNDDFDQDGDGFRTNAWPDQSGAYGDDCADGSELDDFIAEGDEAYIKSDLDGVTPTLEAAGLTAADINPDATNTCYDGIASDCQLDYSDFDCDRDTYYYDEECDDQDPDVFPNDAEDEWYDCVDSNCDGNDADQDGDGYVPDDYAETCDWEQFAAHDGVGDCWDDPDYDPGVGYAGVTAADVNPAAEEVWYDGLDSDCNGESDYDQDLDGYDHDGYGGDDCDDDKDDVNPSEREDCDTLDDDDCSGTTNDESADNCTLFYQDSDGDDYGTTTSRCYCEAFDIYTADNNEDCVDSGTMTGTYGAVSAEDINPGVAEVCNEVDDDCDGRIDDNDPSVTDQVWWYPDDDEDGFGDASDAGSFECFQPEGYVLEDNTDCDDSRDWVNPDGTEECDDLNLDEDCSGAADNDDPGTLTSTELRYYPDADSDDFGDEDSSGFLQCDPTTAYPVLDNTDCDDSRDWVNPDGTEECDELDLDEDCDRYADNDDPDMSDATKVLHYPDEDSDGFGDRDDAGELFCDPTAAYPVTDRTDCNDLDSAINTDADEVCDDDNIDEDCDDLADNDDPGTLTTTEDLYYPDEDSDDFGDIDDPGTLLCDPTTAYPVLDNTDCDDSRDWVNPDGTEECDDLNLDEDCSGAADNDDPGTLTSTELRYYPDADSDDFGDEDSSGFLQCDPTTAYPVLDNTDCDDGRDWVNPDGTEECDDEDLDEDCSGAADNDDPNTLTSTELRYYPDADSDGFGDEDDSGFLQCDPTTAYPVTDSTDCDDGRDWINPDGTEECDDDNLDEDCNGVADNDDSGTLTSTELRYYPDADSDDFGDEDSSGFLQCDPTTAYPVLDNTDCDDGRDWVNPDGTEECDDEDLDEDCSGAADNDDPNTLTSTELRYYPDADSDGFGDEDDSGFLQCDPTTAYPVTDSTDCDDSRDSVNPAEDEICDGSNRDEDCNGVADNDDSGALDSGKTTYYPDVDNDGFGDEDSAGFDLCDPNSTYEVTDHTDCDDSRDSVNPAEDEICDGSNRDEDCNGVADNNDSGALSSGKTTFYPDADNDGFGDISSAGSALCDANSTYEITDHTDCDDSRDYVNPDGTEACDADDLDEDCDGSSDDDDAQGATGKVTYYDDGDSDGYGDEDDAGTAYCDPPSGVVTDNTDCDDSTSAVSPADTEVCDGSNVDEDCDGQADDNDPEGATGKVTWYADDDSDGYGDEDDAGTDYCDPPSGVVTDNTDCDDSTSAVSPADVEICDASNVDEDCDGQADDNDTAGGGATGKTTFYVDADSDGYGDEDDAGTDYCDAPSGYVSDNTDCDDSVATGAGVNPGATEVCDGSNVDEDCDGQADDNDPEGATGKVTWYADDDSDGYGDEDDAGTDYCDPPSGVVTDNTDCNDNPGNGGDINPGATEVCDASNTDEDCDGFADDNDLQGADGQVTYYVDDDGDGYGDETDPGTLYCDPPTGDETDNTDCDDTDAGINPGATDIPGNGIDEDCSGADTELGYLTMADLIAGDLIITEMMTNPDVVADTDGEWFEIYNNSGMDVDLDGMEVYDRGSNTFTVSGTVLVAAGEYAVLGTNSDTGTNGGVDIDYAYNYSTGSAGFALGQADDEVVLSNGSIEIDAVEYDGGPNFPDPTGYSMSLSGDVLDDLDNDDGANWCQGSDVTAEGDFGSPGVANPVCLNHTDDIQPIWDSTCISCHDNASPSAGLDLEVDAYTNIHNVESSLKGYDYIKGGRPDISYLFMKLDGTYADVGGSGSQMPLSGTLDSADFDTIEIWILQGAYE